ncbi:MAG: HRDC domain-containing protein [Pirellulales bacterium]|nr:HRDC domain-containing protein [Pirellulales bacterium]
MTHQFITSAAHLQRFCQEILTEPYIAFDTEFVSEHTYRSELCLIQVAAGEHLAVIDPLAVRDIKPFWDAIVAPGHQTIVHAGREELNFCLQATGERPADLFDVQLAAGLVGNEYPAGYGALLQRLLGISLEKGETRTDWRRRPLSRSQLEYALDDVRHLRAIRDILTEKLTSRGRLGWLTAEMEEWQAEVTEYRTREHWYKISGNTGLSRRSLAILRELWHWREGQAKMLNQPARRVLRDDFLIELAKRRSADIKQIQAIRGLERSDYKRVLPEIADAIERANSLPEGQLPVSQKRDLPQQFTLLGQFLSAALSSICRSQNVAMALVGTATDVRDLIAYRLGYDSGEPPLLAQGWRAEVVGQIIEDLLSGERCIRIVDPQSDDPLRFDLLNKSPEEDSPPK